MLFFFLFWGYNSMNTYMIHPVWTPAAYAIIVALFYGGIVVMYFLIVYLDFPCKLTTCYIATFVICNLVGQIFSTARLLYLTRSIISSSALLREPGSVFFSRFVFACICDSFVCRSPNLRRLFYIVFGFIILADAAVIMLFLIWLALVSNAQTATL